MMSDKSPTIAPEGGSGVLIFEHYTDTVKGASLQLMPSMVLFTTGRLDFVAMNYLKCAGSVQQSTVRVKIDVHS